MRYVSWVRVRAGRLLTILLVILLYFLLLAMDALRFFPKSMTSLSWVQFGFSALVALLFLAVGALVWLYARDRRVAGLLFGFSFTMMLTFAVETAASLNDPLLSAISGPASAFTLLLFFILLLYFPKQYLSSPSQSGTAAVAEVHFRPQRNLLLLRGYLIVLIILSFAAALYSALTNLRLLQLPAWLAAIQFSCDVLVLVSILVTIFISYRRSTSLRERQQRRIFVSGVILAFAPLLLLTVLPKALNLSPIDPQISTFTLVFLPLALGYSILRYQILVFDMYIRHAVAWIVSLVGVAVLGYLVFAFATVLLPTNPFAQIISVIIAMAVLAPFVWWLARIATEHLFFSEIAYYRRLVDQPDLLARKTFDVSSAAQLITSAAITAFETQETCLFVFDEDTGYYQLYPVLGNDPAEASRAAFVRSLLNAVDIPGDGDTVEKLPLQFIRNADWLDSHAAFVERLDSAERPLLLSEACKTDEEMPTGFARYLATTAPLGGFDPLLASIRTQGKMIAILALGERGDRQQYAGPDFEAIDLIQSRFSPVLENARLYQQASRHVAVLDALYSGVAGLDKTFQTVEDAAIAYTRIAAEAVQAGAQVWLCDKSDHQLYSIVYMGSGPHLIAPDGPLTPQVRDWSTWFYPETGIQSWQIPSIGVPPCLPQAPYFPFAWLPLTRGQDHLGVLFLAYPRPHIFSQEEQRVLAMYADQFAAALENADFTVKLRAAYERQKELDRLKDQFIMTASHELRTPLTAVQGYIELLEQYGHHLSPEKRAEFIAKAHRGCDELTLMVGNIMDASRVQVDAEHLTLNPVQLAASTLHIVEILDGVIQREHRSVNIDIPPDIYVLADDLRLRQVLLNLVSNALKYSPVGTDINVTCKVDDEDVTFLIRDRGLGVPPEARERLFERFFRLERDMNSPVRGAGLGLSISKQLIKAMGGRIWVESTGKQGEGSVFAFTLKRARILQKAIKTTLERQEV